VEARARRHGSSAARPETAHSMRQACARCAAPLSACTTKALGLRLGLGLGLRLGLGLAVRVRARVGVGVGVKVRVRVGG
jgi:hypothetical protein